MRFEHNVRTNVINAGNIHQLLNDWDSSILGIFKQTILGFFQSNHEQIKFIILFEIFLLVCTIHKKKKNTHAFNILDDIET